MTELQVNLPDDIAAKVEHQAQALGKSVSEYLSDIIQRRFQAQWPEGFFSKVVGGWRGDRLERPLQGEFDERDAL